MTPIIPKGIGGLGPAVGKDSPQKVDKSGDFKKILSSNLADVKKADAPKELSIKFSNHAVDRMRQRGIHFSQEQLGKIDAAVEKASAKGAKETLVMSDESAMIVSVKNKTVITVMDKEGLKNNVFTNIDSTVFI